MSLLKIPFLVASAIGVHVSLTTLSPPPSSGEKVMPTALESFFRWVLALRGLEIIKVCCVYAIQRVDIWTMYQISAWAASSIEVANILAMHIDPSQIPEGIYGARSVQLLRSLRSTPITPAFLAGSLAIAIGGMLRLYCILTLGKLWSFQLSVRKEHSLVTNGPYSVVRHPSYTGFVLQYVGIIVMYGSRGSWMLQSGILQVPFMKAIAASGFILLTGCTWLVTSRPPVEDKMMQRALGEEWENWARRGEISITSLGLLITYVLNAL
ncbi:hypothetical protein EDB19DRAFT_1207430 [Suillus lakei]|nr:hypothetical protein EDB19DRAFT_1207430 [Suillus lakei]